MPIQKISLTADAVQAEVERRENEAVTHALFKAHFKVNGVRPDEVVMAKVWQARWIDALRLEQIVPMFQAFHSSSTATEEDARAALRTLVRAKVLRSYQERGNRYWEVNY